MASLLDVIRQNSNKTVDPNQAQMTDQTDLASKLLRAKSGKAVGSGDTGASNLGEASAVATTQQGLKQLGTQAQVQNQGVEQAAAGQQQQLDQAKSGIDQSRRFDTIQTKLQTNQVLNDLERNKGQIDLNKQKGAMEQVGNNLRLQNQQYVDNLQREGKKARLDNELEFKTQLANDVIGAKTSLFKDQMTANQLLDLDNNAFKKQLGNMSIDAAWGMWKDNAKAANTRGIYSAAGGLVTAGIGAAGSMPSGGGADTGTTVATGDQNVSDAGSIA